MSIYITQQQKEEWEQIVDGIQRNYNQSVSEGDIMRAGIEHYELKIYKDLLSKATVLPIEENWEEFDAALLSYTRDEEYPNGVIIKQS